MAEYLLIPRIIELSESKVWGTAKLEWSLANIDFAYDPQTCLCGHYPIKEICTIANQKNGERTEVGNCCVKKFLGLPSDLIFQGIKRIKKDNAKALNAESIEYAFGRGWLNDWEYMFSLQMVRKRKLSPKQMAKRKEINQRLIRKLASSANKPKILPPSPAMRSRPPMFRPNSPIPPALPE